MLDETRVSVVSYGLLWKLLLFEAVDSIVVSFWLKCDLLELFAALGIACSAKDMTMKNIC
jgi:hypothetical protein